MEEYQKSRDDLSAAQQIDYDDAAAEDLKFVLEQMKEIEGEKVKKKLVVSEALVLLLILYRCYVCPMLIVLHFCARP